MLPYLPSFTAALWMAPPAVLQPQPHSWIIERSWLGSPSAKETRLLRVRDIKISSAPASIPSNPLPHRIRDS
ncbi:hypothetical protein BHM03_00037560 [Ensete ventricosum]|nr:hypothetical protein BHM03_00037560 [Ensete ventricosum]